MKKLFDETSLAGVSLVNRFIRSATQEVMADIHGGVTQQHLEVYSKLAEGQVGMIITGWAFVLADGRGVPKMLGIDDDSLLDGFRELTKQVHQQGSKIILQIGYGGIQSLVDEPNVYSPSTIPDIGNGKVGKPMAAEDIIRLKVAFGEAAARAKSAGFDGIQIHAGHGFLLSQFLSPYYNHRTDKFGGSIENRARLLYEIYDEIRRKTGKDFVVLAKINCADFIDGGLTFEDSLYVCEQLALKGIDALEISGGIHAISDKSTVRRHILLPEQEAYFEKYAVKIAAKVNVPIILVGGLRSLEVMERILNETNIAYFAMCRPLIAEPGLVKRWQEGEREKAKCVSCGKCITPNGTRCAIFDENE